MKRKIEIRDPRLGGADEHEVVFTTEYGPGQSTGHVEGLTHAELAALYVLIELRLRETGMSRPRIVKTGEMQVAYQNRDTETGAAMPSEGGQPVFFSGRPDGRDWAGQGFAGPPETPEGAS
jgi:hypothetical protein